MTLEDYENSELETRERLKNAARGVTESYEKGQRWFDQMKELILIEHGLKFTSDFFHDTAHWFAGEFDKFGDILHQKHIIQEYGSTGGFYEMGLELSDYLKYAIDTMDEILTSLAEFVRLADEVNEQAIARDTENLMVRLGRRRENFYYVWKMCEEADDTASFDKWVKKLTHRKAGD